LIDPQRQHEIEQLLYHEADLLDHQRYREWLDLFTEDAHYLVPIRETTTAHPDGLPPAGEIRVAHLDDDRRGLEMRLFRFETGQAHAEDPPSRTRRLVGNVRVAPPEAGELQVHSNFMLFQSRRETAEFLFVGQREDRLRQVDGSWRIARRTVLLDHNVLPRSISVFF